MIAKVDQELCVGCGLCADTCPETFIMEEDKAKIKANPVPANAEDSCKKVKEDCPVEAISIEE